jgi:hypothetical protein
MQRTIENCRTSLLAGGGAVRAWRAFVLRYPSCGIRHVELGRRQRQETDVLATRAID